MTMTDTTSTPAGEQDATAHIEEAAPGDEQIGVNVLQDVAGDPDARAQNEENTIETQDQENPPTADDGKVYLRIRRPAFLTTFVVSLEGESYDLTHEPTQFPANVADDIIKSASNEGVLVEKVGK